MAQGAIKKNTKAAPTGKPKQQQYPRAAKVNKPQKAKVNTSADRMQKKFSAGLVAKTEKLLGQRAGHLELLGTSKKNAKKDEKEKPTKGGSRKFG